MLKWTEIDMPWFEVGEFLDIVLDNVHILDICDKWGLEYSASTAGEFTHRMKCPLPIHDDGGERTASFFMSEIKNNFYCFGCNSGGNIVNFVALYSGKPFHESLKWLAAIANITDENIEDGLKNIPKREKRNPETMMTTHVFRSGVTIRKHLESVKGKQEYNKWCRWADTVFLKLDKYLDLPDDEWEKAKSYHDKIHNFIKSKV